MHLAQTKQAEKTLEDGCECQPNVKEKAPKTDAMVALRRVKLARSIAFQSAPIKALGSTRLRGKICAVALFSTLHNAISTSNRWLAFALRRVKLARRSIAFQSAAPKTLGSTRFRGKICAVALLSIVHNAISTGISYHDVFALRRVKLASTVAFQSAATSKALGSTRFRGKISAVTLLATLHNAIPTSRLFSALGRIKLGRLRDASQGTAGKATVDAHASIIPNFQST